MFTRILYLISGLMALVFCGCTHPQKTIGPLPVFSLHKNVVYGTDPLQQNMDLYLPAVRDVSNTPVVILIHGGAWVQGDKADFNGLGIDTFFTAHGCAVVNMNYRLDGTYKYPAPVDDVGLVMDKLKQKAGEWQINPNRVCLLGRSTGAHLALVYAYTRNGDKRVKAVLDFFGPTSLTDSTITGTAFGMNVAYLLGDYLTNQGVWHNASPVFFTRNAVPTFIFQGTADSLIYFHQSQRLLDSLQVNGIANNLVRMEGLGHGWSQAYWVQWRDAVYAWLQQYL